MTDKRSDEEIVAATIPAILDMVQDAMGTPKPERVHSISEMIEQDAKKLND